MNDLIRFDDPRLDQLLDAYHAVGAKAPKEDKRWVPRVTEIEGWPSEELATVHGMAIAADLLEIRVEDATSGLRYRARKAA